jgi:hypothetical protein
MYILKRLCTDTLISLGELDVLCRMCRDKEASVVMAVIRCATRIFRPLMVLMLRIGNTVGANVDEASSVLVMLNQLKRLILEMFLTHEHIGVRMRAIKFIEVLLLCYTLPDLRVQSSVNDVFHPLLVPSQHPLLVPATLKDEGENLANLLATQLHSATHASVAATIVGALGVVCRQRSSAITVPLIQTLLRVVTEPPPALTASHITSLRALVRVMFLTLLKLKLIPLIPGKKYRCRVVGV